MMFENMVFMEVDTEDEQSIRDAFPQARINTNIISEDEIITQYPDAEILCVFIYSQVTKKVIDSLPNLKLIVTRSVGYNHIDLQAAAEKNIPVCNVPDYGSHVIAEHVFALLLSTIRNVQEGDDRTEQQNFDFHGLRGIALKGKTLGIIGTGKIGKNVARIASMGFLMNVIAYDPYPDIEASLSSHFSYVSSLDDIWNKSDVISFHVPLLESTKHMVNDETIHQMKDGVILVNTARGDIINTSSLINGLQSKKISHAALDVLEHEKNISHHTELLTFPNVTITPHIAFYADDAMKKMYTESFESIRRFINNEDLIHRVVGQ